MKKLFFTLCALCLCGTMWAQDATQDESTGLWYTLDGENATIVAVPEGETAYTVANLTLVEEGKYSIPETVAGYTVTAIGNAAFSGAFTDTSNLIHLVIPANVVTFNGYGFQNCTQIQEVTVEYGETALNEANTTSYCAAFRGCTNLKTVTTNRDITHGRNNSQTAYYVHPFCCVPSIETVYIGEEVTAITNNAFNANGTSQLSAVYCYATDHVPTLANQCFLYQAEGCTLYVYDELVETFTADKNDANNGWGDIFSKIQGMGSAPLEEGTYQDVATGLFFEINEDGATASIYHDEAGIYTDDNLVAHATITGAYTLPETVSADGETYYNVTRVDDNAFDGSSISGHLVIPSYITNLGTAAFRNCTELTEVTFEYSETTIYDECADSNQGDECFIGCSNLSTVNLYRDVTLAGGDNVIDGSFAYHSAIATINIGPRVTEIPHHMFNTNNSSYSLTTINCYAVVPPTLGNATFRAQYLNSAYVVNVPFGTEEAYLSDTGTYGWATMFAYDTSTLAGHIAEMSDAFAITTHDNNDGTAYATFYNGASDVELFDGELTAYYAYQLDNEDDGLYIEIAEIGNTVPAGTGVVVETEAEGTYLAIATGTTTSFTETNDLYGYDSAQTIADPSGSYYYYLLSSYNGQVGFYYGAEGGVAFTCQAHKAYLALLKTAVTNSNGISIRKGNGGEDTTGISSVESATEGATVKGIYTIQGVRVNNMNQPGLYIVDGKKVLVK